MSRRWSPYVYGYNNPVRFVDPDGMEATDTKTTTEYTYSDGYSTQSSRTSTASLGYEGVGVFVEREGTSTDSQTQGGGQEPIKGGGFPKGEIRSTTEQNAVIRPADGLRYTEVEKAMQLGVDMASTVEGGYGLLKLGKRFVGLFRNVDDAAHVTQSIENVISTELRYEKQVNEHMLGGSQLGDNSYLLSTHEAKSVLNAAHNGEAKVLSVNMSQNRVYVQYEHVIGYYNNNGIVVPTNTFLIKGGKSATVVPVHPNIKTFR